MGSLLLWAIKVKASELRLLPEAEQVIVQFKIGDALQTVMALPKSLQEALALRFKAAGEIGVLDKEAVQEGLIPIQYRKVVVEAVIVAWPTDYGEQMTVALTLLPK